MDEHGISIIFPIDSTLVLQPLFDWEKWQKNRPRTQKLEMVKGLNG